MTNRTRPLRLLALSPALLLAQCAPQCTPAPPPRAVASVQPEIVPNPPYAFSLTPSGQPIAWKSCLTLHWVYLADGEPSPEAINVIREAMAQTSAASGIEVIEDGGMPDPAQPTPEGLVIIRYASLAGDVAGTTVHTGIPDISRAVVSLDRDRNLFMAVVLHEIGHALGLQHSGGTQIMAPRLSSTSPDHLGTGDRAGLDTLRNRACAA